MLCPGEAVGTLKKLGLDEPDYAGFAGPVLFLTITIPPDKLASFKAFNHCMEVHQEGVVLAWQAKIVDDKIIIGVGGTKAYYGDQQPHKDQEFAKNRNLLQLNMINDVLPDCISLALGRDTKGQKLTEEDLNYLVRQDIAERWVGTRAVAYDGFPSLGHVYNNLHRVANARCTTHLGSGGVSFAPAAVVVSRTAMCDQDPESKLVQDVLMYANSSRTNQDKSQAMTGKMELRDRRELSFFPANTDHAKRKAPTDILVSRDDSKEFENRNKSRFFNSESNSAKRQIRATNPVLNKEQRISQHSRKLRSSRFD